MLEGEIRDIDLVARLVDLWREQFTGAIRFENDGIIKIIYFKGGDVLSASTNDRSDSVDEILMRAGKVSREHVKQALTKRKENETLGDTLLNLGFITRKELSWARRVQVVGVIRSIGEWTAGQYTIVADYLPKRDEGTIFPLPQIIVEMVVTDQDRPKFERLLDSGSLVFSKVPGFAEAYGKLGLNEEADAIVAQVDGTRTASEVAAESHQDAFNAYKLMHALSLLQLLTRPRVLPLLETPAVSNVVTQAPPMLEPLGLESEGVADAADAFGGPMPSFKLDDEGPGAETTPLRTPAPPVLTPDPTWDLAPEPVAGAPVTTAGAKPAAQEEWGFDEAQIEAARKATLPSTPEPLASAGSRPTRDYSSTMTATRRHPTKTLSKKKSHFGLIVTLMAVFIVAGVSWYGFTLWDARNSEVQPLLVRRQPRKPPAKATPAPVLSGVPAPSPAVATTTTAPPPTTTHAAAGGGAPPGTATTAPAPRVAVAKPAPAPVQPKPIPPKPAPPNPGPPKSVPVTTIANDRDQYDAMARDYAAKPNGKFTVQFEIVCDPSNIRKALREGSKNVWFVPISLKGRPCYRVFWGRYETRAAAERGMREIPAALREAPPSVIAVPQP